MSTDIHAAAAARLGSGGRYTRPRRQLVEVLGSARQPMTIREIVAQVPELSASSVYRNLAMFEETGLVHRITGQGDFARFELAEELVGHHHHLACRGCGAMTDVELPAELEAQLDKVLAGVARRKGFRVDAHRLDLVGLCSTCARTRR